MTKCAICVLEEQGVMDADKHVLPQYIMTDPNKPPIPVNAEGEDAIFLMFPEEQDTRVKSSGGIMGTAKAIYRALGFGKEPEKAPTESRKAAIRKRNTGLYD